MFRRNLNPFLPALALGLLFVGCGGGGDSLATSPPASPPPPGGTSIADIQGSGDASPLAGQNVTVEGIVSGDFQSMDGDAGNDLGGFYIQSAAPDGDAGTSDGIFVFDGENPAVDVNIGDRVVVSGLVQEYFGETQLAASSVDVTGTATVNAIQLSLPAAGFATNSDGDAIADLERYEGMLVQLSQSMSVTDLRNLERFGALGLSSGGRLFQFTNSAAPSVVAYAAYEEATAKRSLVLDDGRRSQNVAPIRYLDLVASSGSSLRAGDSVAGLSGNLRYSRGSGGSGAETWRLMPTVEPVFVVDNPRPGPPAVSGTLKVASFNVQNYFSTTDTGADVCGPSGDDGCRGADSALELSRQLEKIVTAITMMDADIIGLIELENNVGDSLDDIVNALNAAVGSTAYAAIASGTIGDDAIKTGFIYKSTTVAASGSQAVLDASVDARFNSSRNRPALAQTFRQLSNDARMTVIVNHLKSKGSDCEAESDPNTNDGQANCNLTRTRAAAALADWADTDPTGSNDSDYLVIGDLNAYLQEDPITTLEAAGLVNLITTNSGADAYSFLFDGRSGALDHALASSSLAPQVTEIIEWHINADESPAFDYNLEFGRDAALFDGSTPYRASDHDPIIIGLELGN